MKIAAIIYTLSALGCGVALINENSKYSMILGGISIISFITYTLLVEHEHQKEDGNE